MPHADPEKQRKASRECMRRLYWKAPEAAREAVRTKIAAMRARKHRERIQRIQARAQAAMEWEPTEYGYSRRVVA